MNIWNNDVIGVYYYYDSDFDFVTVDKLLLIASSNNKDKSEILKYFDWKYKCNLIRFNYCPFSGNKINWDKIRNKVKKYLNS